jgi:hypothetical protein
MFCVVSGSIPHVSMLQSSFERARMYHQPDVQGLMVAQIAVGVDNMTAALEFSITGTSGMAGLVPGCLIEGSLCQLHLALQ